MRISSHLLLSAVAAVLLLSSCGGSYARGSFPDLKQRADQHRARVREMTAENEADRNAVKKGTLSQVQFRTRKKARFAEFDEISVEMNSILAQMHAINSRGLSSGSGYAPSDSYPVSPAASSLGTYTGHGIRLADSSSPEGGVNVGHTARSSTVYESDLTYGKTLGGIYGVSDRHGNTTLIEHNLGGGYTTTGNSGYHTDWSQNVGGGYTGRDSRGTTWQPSTTLSGVQQVKGSNGRTYSREQTLGGGYKWTQD